MEYKKVIIGTFCERKNRFIAVVEIKGKKEICHVKNTGRLKELFLPGAEVGLSVSDNPARKTKYDVVSVKKDGAWINVDSQAPNIAAGEWLKSGGLGQARLVRSEYTYMPSDGSEKARFDFYLEFASGEKAFVEVKGVTLKIDGVARFPDAPTERGIKHLHALCDALKNGYRAYILFVIQMKGVDCFSPNDKTHPAFGAALRWAAAEGVCINAVDCAVTKDEMMLENVVRVELS